ncbi:Germin protein [Dioscorea alata]|uniref:Germin protein n=1 Tax=Dioscorea alata TaxID=55571 RepID=A0ACB7U8Q2_DIOAL|nr:Germin protein [Dioscorea alata]
MRTRNSAAVQDFCVGDLTGQENPAGYPCKNISKVTASDFYFPDFFTPHITFAPRFNVSATYGFTNNFPGVNGLGLSMVYFAIEVNSSVPSHAHPRANEVIIMLQGTILAGFISSDNKPYYKILQKGDVFIFPQDLLHFEVNVGNTTAKILAGFEGSSPGIQGTTMSWASSDLSSEIIEKVFQLDQDVVEKVKEMFGGTN